LGSWGSAAGLRRVARLGDGWLASAYNTDPQTFSTALTRLGGEFPHALVTMWTWITDREADAERMRTEVLAPFLYRGSGAVPAPGPGLAARPALRRFLVDVRRATVPVRRGGLSARPFLAVG